MARGKRQFDGCASPRREDPPDCRGCGAGCFSPSETFVRVTGGDWTRLGEAAERVAHFLGNRAFVRMSEGRCAARAIHRAADGAPDFFCKIYERRPQVCRDPACGSPACAGELTVKQAGAGESLAS